MKEAANMIGKMITLHSPAFQAYIQAPKSAVYTRLIVVMLGILYGLTGIAANAAFIASFESAILRNAIVPLIFILFGLFSVWLTRLGLAVLLWAGAKGFGGPGKISELNRTAGVALIPGIMALPALTGMSAGLLITIALIIGVIWMYFICVKIHEVTQGFAPWKAYGSVFAVFIFFASIFYIIMPQGAIN